MGWQLEVLFVPPSPGFHLYSLSLPDGGVEGLGIPTRLSVRGALVATGAVTAGEPTQLLDIAALGVKLPVYPDGPVTLALPVRHTDGLTAQVVVSYGACSSATCLAPVIDEAIPLSVP
jgi:Disulphide bond corrector protein DsbC